MLGIIKIHANQFIDVLLHINSKLAVRERRIYAVYGLYPYIFNIYFPFSPRRQYENWRLGGKAVGASV